MPTATNTLQPPTGLRLFAYVIAFLPFQVYFSIGSAPFGVCYIPLIAMGIFAFYKGLLKPPLMSYSVALFLLSIVLSSGLSSYPYVAFRKNFAFFCGTLCYIFVTVNIHTMAQVLFLSRAMYIGGIFVGIVGIGINFLLYLVPRGKDIWFSLIIQHGEVLFGPSVYEAHYADYAYGIIPHFLRRGQGIEGWFTGFDLTRNIGPFSMHYEMGIYMAIMALLSLSYYLSTKKKIHIVAAIVFFICLMTTLSRSSYFAFAGGFMTFLWFLNRMHTGSMNSNRRLVNYLAILFAVLGVILPGAPINAVIFGIYKIFVDPGGTDYALRLYMLGLSTPEIFESIKNILFGIGRSVLEYKTMGTFIMGYSSHFGPINLLTDLGLFGLSAFILMLFSHYREAFLLIRWSNGKADLYLPGLVAISFVFTIIMAFLFAVFLSSHKLMPIIMCLLAMIHKMYGIASRLREDSKAKPPATPGRMGKAML